MTEIKIVIISAIVFLVSWFMHGIFDTRNKIDLNIRFTLFLLVLASAISVIIFSVIFIIKL